MNPKKIKAFILDGNRDLHERLFVLSMIIMLVVLKRHRSKRG